MKIPAKPVLPKNKRVKLIIVDDHPIVRRGLTLIINQEQDMIVCGEADTGPKALEIIKLLDPQVALIDITLKEENGLELIKDIKTRFPKILILVLSMHEEIFYAERALRAGAKGYVMKQQMMSVIFEAIRKIVAGDIYLSETMSAKILRGFTGEKTNGGGFTVTSLSDRELEVFRLIGSGYGTRQIAKRFSRSVKTIETYREHIKQKLDFENSAEMTQTAIQWNQSNAYGA